MLCASHFLHFGRSLYISLSKSILSLEEHKICTRQGKKGSLKNTFFFSLGWKTCLRMSSAFWAGNSSIKAASEGNETMLRSTWHCLTQSRLNSNVISPSTNTLSVGLTGIKLLAIPTDTVPDAPACFPLRKAANLLSFAVQWPWHDGRLPLPQPSGVHSAWEDGCKQAGPTSPGFSDCYETAEEGTCLDALIQTQRGWKYLVQLFVGREVMWRELLVKSPAFNSWIHQSLRKESTSWTCTDKACHIVSSFESSIKSLWFRAKHIIYRCAIAANHLC